MENGERTYNFVKYGWIVITGTVLITGIIAIYMAVRV